MTLAPPPATIVQIRPFGFNTVNFKDALVCNIERASKLTTISNSIIAIINTLLMTAVREV